MNELSSVPTDELEYTLEAAMREAVDDHTFNKVNRCSYNASTKNVTNNLVNNTGSSLDSQLFLCSSPLLSFILSLFLVLFFSFFPMCHFSPDYLPCILPYSFVL
jgi:predicted PurR-regulated permease PerM